MRTPHTPKPTPRDLARETRRLGRLRLVEAADPRVVELRATPEPRRELSSDPDPKDAA